MMRSIALLALLTLTTACIKSAEQIQREKRFESMSEQMTDSRSLIANINNQLSSMQSQLDNMQNKIDQIEHKQKQVNPETIKQLNENMALMKAKSEADTTQMTQIQNELKEQRGFIEKVTESLGALSQANSKPAKKKSAKEDLAAALELVKNNKYSEARFELEGFIDHSDLSPGDKNKVLHGLGRVEFYTKNYEKALVYFSKLYTKFPKSSLAASSLLFIAKSLDKLGKKDEAKEAFTKVTQDYPSSKEASEAKKSL